MVRRRDVAAQITLCLEALLAEGASVAGREVPGLHVAHHVVVFGRLHLAVGANEVAELVLDDEGGHGPAGAASCKEQQPCRLCSLSLTSTVRDDNFRKGVFLGRLCFSGHHKPFSFFF